MFTLSVYNVQLKYIGRAKCIVCPTNPTVGRATALPAHLDRETSPMLPLCWVTHWGGAYNTGPILRRKLQTYINAQSDGDSTK